MRALQGMKHETDAVLFPARARIIGVIAGSGRREVEQDQI